MLSNFLFPPLCYMLTDLDISYLINLEIPGKDHKPMKVNNEVHQFEKYTQLKKCFL
jgi:hypothetical protein